MITLTIDGKPVSVPKGTTVYHAAKQLGADIPIFCYHDRMPPFGACRACLVEVDKMPKLQASCCLEATEGMVVKTQSDPAVKGRKEILEYLLINHPLDCPICDKGGECPLQDQTLSDGPGQSRFTEDKRRFKKALPLGPLLMLDRERCIVCARCTRFGDLVAGDHALELIDRGYKSEVGTPSGEPVQSKFIGNTIKICPVGALTSQVYRFRARPWDNQSTPSTCTLCPVGCSLNLDARDGEILRTRSRENKAVNDIWLCDKGWFGYEFATSPTRLQNPLIRKQGTLQEASWEEALSLIASKIQTFQATGELAAWGGNPLTLEENYLFQKLFREVIGVNHVDHRLGQPDFSLEEEVFAPGMQMAISEIENLQSAALLGLDLTEEFPVIWLRLKQAINKGAKVHFSGHFAPEILYHLSSVQLHAPDGNLEVLKTTLARLEEEAVKKEACALFVGRQYLESEHRAQILGELAHFISQHPHITLNIMEGRGNSLGARLAGMHPELYPLEQRAIVKGLSAIKVLEQAARSSWGLIWVAGADPVQKFPVDLWKTAREKLGFLVVQDLFLTDTAKQADVVLPTLCYLEKTGSFINLEKNRQKLLPGKEVPQHLFSDGEIFCQIATKLGADVSLAEDFFEKVNASPHIFDKICATSAVKTLSPTADNEIRASFSAVLFDEGVRMLHNSHLSKVIKRVKVRLHPAEAEKRQLQDNERVVIKSATGELIASILLDNNVSLGTLVLPLGFEELPVHNLSVILYNGLALSVSKEGSHG